LKSTIVIKAATTKIKDYFHYTKEAIICTTKLTSFTISKDEWNKNEDTGKSMKNALYVLHMVKVPFRLKQH